MHLLSTLFYSLALFFGYHPALGAALPGATAVFETSLASPITSSATSMTLTANSVRGGGSISGYNCFTVDEGSAQAETICGTVAATAVSSLSRGISQSTGTTTVAALQFAHRRGANVKISDFPLIQILKAQSNGEDTYPNILNYTSHPTFTGITNLVDKKYVDDTAFSGAGVVDATNAARGVVELATGAEIAASTAQGSSGVLAIPASLATSTYNSATAANRAVVTGAGGTIDANFIPATIPNTHTFSGTNTFAATTTMATTTINGGYPLSLIFSTTTTQAMTYATTSTVYPYSFFTLVVSAPSMTVGIPTLCLNFNSDFSTNYGTVSIQDTTLARNSTTNSIQIGSSASATIDLLGSFDINNTSTKRKLGTFSIASSSVAVTLASTITGSFVWNNTSTQITSFVVNGSSATCGGGGVPSGTRIDIYAAK